MNEVIARGPTFISEQGGTSDQETELNFCSIFGLMILKLCKIRVRSYFSQVRCYGSSMAWCKSETKTLATGILAHGTRDGPEI